MKIIILFIVTVLLIACSTTKMYQAPPDWVNYDEAPIPTKKIPPTYPSTMKNMEIEGEVFLKIQVLKDGTVGEIEIVRSAYQELDNAAVKAIKQWEFIPGKRDGKIIDCWIQFPIKFNLK